jgi:hypothetical protein
MRLTDWANFFSAEVGASAALVGLVTVAISINLSRILEIAHLPGRAGESLFSLTATLAISGVALFPRLPGAAFGLLALVLSAISLVFGMRVQWASQKMAGGLSIGRHIVGATGRLAAAVPISVGGALLLNQASVGITWIASGVVVTLAVSVMNAWVLLVEINR